MIFFIVLPFLALGCLVFVVCAAIPPLQRFTLGTALWCVILGPIFLGVSAILLLCTAGIEALGTLLHSNSTSAILGIGGSHSWLSWVFATVIFLAIAATATGISVLHGIVIRRLTLALFRIYLAAVSFCVGMLSCMFLSIGLGSFGMKISLLNGPLGILFLSVFGVLIASGIAYACFVSASRFRGSYPDRLPLVTREEFG